MPGRASQLERWRAMLGLHLDWQSGRSDLRTVWRRISDPQKGQARRYQSLQPDELGTGRLGAMPNMVRQSPLTDRARPLASVLGAVVTAHFDVRRINPNRGPARSQLGAFAIRPQSTLLSMPSCSREPTRFRGRRFKHAACPCEPTVMIYRLIGDVPE